MNRSIAGIMLLAGLAGATAARAAETPMPPAAPQVQVVDPRTIAPTITPGNPAAEKGLIVQRLVIGAANGATGLDMDHNSWKGGLDTTFPLGFGYRVEELCYLHSGRFEMESDGVTTIMRPGNFLWRPADALTQRGHIVEDSTEICAFAPVRQQDGYRLTKTELEALAARPADRPRMRFYDYRYYEAVPRPGDTSGLATTRRIVTRERDGTQQIEASHDSYRAGYADGPFSNRVDEICWVESGEMELVANSARARPMRARAGDFIFRPARSVTWSRKAAADTVEICFTGPAAGAAGAHVKLP
ncbi:hypothetical protein GCM10007897_38100 [Sphingobium jiangsuense]|uniref:Ethanolamine utilization protein EutQ (Cupin superfamily) n=1 Tax=Sphingobium jiangsuense TaxID=870476 RepID=A0A7W6BNA0_9SPHN|nr:hypothetical protein [Sphingobium jiangsuense]MBB3926722.1 ethanolamine utilization protein EutQ (cupin superfamily) [Sphingobium jiangsuense]GLT02402.1 hypothetical protein GCM10007897_38100 [Sphingobium jiangsuense]